MKIAKHRGMARARVGLARKLAVVLHRMWSEKRSSASARSPARLLVSPSPDQTKGQARGNRPKG